ncbi:hypothetical protein TRIUR3_35072 [Triticum urartu]|uniref:Light-mediated development protein DET1 n=1 Tax=Triticum urartu TaxID=4572 RepID=M7YMZ0_TRIUA|nr:hypothetical protein TRIUR3_35072 [Triticum urartu]
MPPTPKPKGRPKLASIDPTCCRARDEHSPAVGRETSMILPLGVSRGSTKNTKSKKYIQVNTVRQFYENLVPSYTIYDIDCPDYSFRKFTDDGKYLVAFSRNHQDLIVYRPIWLTFSCHEECDSHDLPANAERFDSFFKQLYSISLASSNEYICEDFFLYMECHQYGLFATSTARSNESSVTEGAIHGVPSIEKITFYLVRLEDGAILDEKAFCNDFINLAHSIGAYLYEDLVCIVSLRYQTIHVLQIRDSGSLVEVRRIGAFCREDDELFLYSHGQLYDHFWNMCTTYHMV